MCYILYSILCYICFREFNQHNIKTYDPELTTLLILSLVAHLLLDSEGLFFGGTTGEPFGVRSFEEKQRKILVSLVISSEQRLIIMSDYARPRHLMAPSFASVGGGPARPDSRSWAASSVKRFDNLMDRARSSTGAIPRPPKEERTDANLGPALYKVRSSP